MTHINSAPTPPRSLSPVGRKRPAPYAEDSNAPARKRQKIEVVPAPAASGPAPSRPAPSPPSPVPSASTGATTHLPAAGSTARLVDYLTRVPADALELTGALRQLFPQASLSQLVTMPVTPLRGGTHSDVLALHTQNGPVVLRHTRDVSAQQAQGLVESFGAMRRAANIGLAPQLFHVNTRATVSLQEQASGWRLDDYLRRQGQPPLAPLGQAVALLHGQPAAGRTLDLDARIRRTWQTGLTCGAVYPPSHETWRLRIGEAALHSALPDTQYTFSHTDLNPTNVFLHADGTTPCFIDWDFSGRAHPYDDLAILSFHLELEGAQEAQLLEHYLGRAPAVHEAACLYLRRLMMTFLMGTWALQQPYRRLSLQAPALVHPWVLESWLISADVPAANCGWYRNGDPTNAADFLRLGMMRLKKLDHELHLPRFVDACRLLAP